MENDNKKKRKNEDDNATAIVKRINNDLPVKHQDGPVTFEKLPAEIQIKVFKETIKGPLIHFAVVKKVPSLNGAGWSTKLVVKPKNQDTSGFRMLKEFKEISSTSARAVKDVERDMIPRTRIGFTRVAVHFSFTDDIVCFEFDRAKTPLMHFRYFSRELQFLTNDQPNHYVLKQQLMRYRRVAVVWKPAETDAGHQLCHVFPCFASSLPNNIDVRNPYSHKAHESWKICPTELAGFFDCFTFLSSAYIIFLPNSGQYSLEKQRIDDYIKLFRAMTSTERLSGGFEVFYDTKYAYIELRPALLIRNHLNFGQAVDMLFPLAFQTQQSLQVPGNSAVTGTPIPYNLSPERRWLLRVKVMMRAGPKENF